MKSRFPNLIAALLIVTVSLATANAATGHSSLEIAHTPIRWGVKGQPLTLKAGVTGGVGGVSKVTLYYALFRDAAPFKVQMASSGIGLYVGTIESGLLSGVNTLSYYIEAEDTEGTIEETPWYDVTFKDPDPAQRSRGATQTIAPTGAAGSSQARGDEGGSGATVGIIAGGAAAIAVGAYVISDSDSGSSSGGSDDSEDAAGTYTGTATTCLTVPPSGTTCSNTSITILIDPNGKVFSDDLLPGKQLLGDLNGNTFVLQGDTSNGTNFTGTIFFGGTVVGNDTIQGNISGDVTDNGSPGFYSGDFNATK